MELCCVSTETRIWISKIVNEIVQLLIISKAVATGGVWGCHTLLCIYSSAYFRNIMSVEFINSHSVGKKFSLANSEYAPKNSSQICQLMVRFTDQSVENSV